MRNIAPKTYNNLSALSIIGWVLFLILTNNEIRSLISSFLKDDYKHYEIPIFISILIFFSIFALLIAFQKNSVMIADTFFRIILGGTFLLAAIPKILDPQGFAIDISHYAIFPKWTINIIAITVPWIEVFIAISIIFKIAYEGGVLLINMMLIAFLILLAQAWIRGLDIDCGCFGHSGARESVSKAFIRDLFYVVWAILLFLYSKHQPHLEKEEAK